MSKAAKAAGADFVSSCRWLTELTGKKREFEMASVGSNGFGYSAEDRSPWPRRCRVTACAVLILLSSCSGRNTGTADEKNRTAEANVVVPETPAPLQPAGKIFVYNFDNDTADQIPARFHSALTGQGAKAEWQVKPDPTAPSSPNVLAQVSTDRTDYRFPLAIADDGSFKDLELSVKFKTISGQIDQAAGLVFRLKDANNYYIVRANTLEGNYRLYRVVNGRREQIAGANLQVPSEEWHELSIVCSGNSIACYFDGEKKIEATDDTFSGAGKVGLWTKADSVTFFDDLKVTAR
jgi:hypothetical protein